MSEDSGFNDGIEFEETFPESVAKTEVASPAPAPSEIGILGIPVPDITLAPEMPVFDGTEALFQEQLDRRLREAEAMVKQTIERMRLAEEQRLVEWVDERRAEEERRIAKWADERRASLERSMEQRNANAEGLAERLQAMLAEWQDRFEQRMHQRRVDEDRLAERRRISDEERLHAWRSGLEQALTERFTQQQSAERAPLPDRNGELRASVRDAVAMTTSARDVGRVLRDVLAELTHTAAFALSLHHADRDEVAYRYRVASDNELGTLLRRDVLDDGPQSAVSFADGWARARRTVRIGSSNVTVHTAQLALRASDATIGVLTLQSEGDAIGDSILSRVADLAALVAPHLGALRDNGSYRAV
jgi:hypothetical protein